jgi:hypothetical protein
VLLPAAGAASNEIKSSAAAAAAAAAAKHATQQHDNRKAANRKGLPVPCQLQQAQQQKDYYSAAHPLPSALAFWTPSRLNRVPHIAQM